MNILNYIFFIYLRGCYCFNINRFFNPLLYTALCELCSSCTFVEGKRKFVLFKSKLTVYIKLLIAAAAFWCIMTANRECVPSSSPSPSSYLDVLLKKKNWHVWLNKSSCNLSLCNYLPTSHHSNAVRCWPDPGTQQLRK